MIVSSHMYNAATGYYHNIIKSLTITSVIYIIKWKVDAYVCATVDSNSRSKQTQSMNEREKLKSKYWITNNWIELRPGLKLSNFSFTLHTVNWCFIFSSLAVVVVNDNVFFFFFLHYFIVSFLCQFMSNENSHYLGIMSLEL